VAKGNLPHFVKIEMPADDMTETTKIETKKSTPEQIRKKREAAKAAVAMLAEAYPGVFDIEQPKPLKIGIHNDLTVDAKISKTQMRKALSAYTRHYNYIACVAEGGLRVGLDGEVGAEVTAEEIEHAKSKVSEIDQARVDRKKQQENRKKHQARKKDKENRLEKKLEALINKSTN